MEKNKQEKNKHKTAVIMLALFMMFSFFPIDVAAYSIAENETEVSEKSSMVSEDSLQSADENAENNAEQQSGGLEGLQLEAITISEAVATGKGSVFQNDEKQNDSDNSGKEDKTKETKNDVLNNTGSSDLTREAVRGAQEVDATITDFRIEKPIGTEVTELDKNTSFYLAMDWKVKDPEAILNEGDYFDIQLPDNLRFPPGYAQPEFELKDDTGEVIARAQVTPGDNADSAGGTIRVTFNDKINGKYNVKGTIYLGALFNKSQITDNEKNVFEVSVNGETATTEVTPIKIGLPPDYVLGKWGERATSNGQPVDKVYWYASINYKKADLKNLIITDELSGNESYITDSFRLTEVEYNDEGGVIKVISEVNINGKISFGPDDRSFSIDLGDMGTKQYRLVYATTFTPGTELKNKLKITFDGETAETISTYRETTAGGTAGGDLANKIKLIKVDVDDEKTVLAGAVFRVTKPDGSAFELVTDENGEALSELLVAGEYKVVEVQAPDGYVLDDQEHILTVRDGEGTTEKITNELEKTEVSGSKTWEDNDDQDGARPESITINLLADGEIKESKTVTAADNWSWSFTDLPKFSNGSEISYSITEDAVTDYSTEYNGYDVTNTHTPGKTSISVTKAWDDNNDQDGIRPQSIIVKLLADGNDTGKTKELNAGNNWTDSFTDLDEYSNGRKITYTIEEATVEGYTSEITGDSQIGFIITNTHTPEVTEVSGSKTWKDNDDQDGARPESITINLLVDGHIKESKTVTAADNWSWSFTDLPKFSSGREISYSITEDAVTDYSTEYDGFDVTNTHTPGRTSISVTKSWDDNNDQDGIRPNWVTVKLLADGKETGSFVKLKESNGWTASFTDLEKYENGKLIDYTVSETEVYGYTAKISGNADEGYVITNTHNPEKTKAANTPSKTGRPKTGDETQIALYMGILAAAGLAILIMTILRRKED